MCLSVTWNRTGTVKGNYAVSVLQGNVFNDLVHGTLYESGIDRHHRNKSSGTKPTGKGNRMFLGNSNVKKTFRIFSGKGIKSCPLGHGGCNGSDFSVPAAKLNHFV